MPCKSVNSHQAYNNITLTAIRVHTGPGPPMAPCMYGNVLLDQSLPYYDPFTNLRPLHCTLYKLRPICILLPAILRTGSTYIGGAIPLKSLGIPSTHSCSNSSAGYVFCSGNDGVERCKNAFQVVVSRTAETDGFHRYYCPTQRHADSHSLSASCTTV